MSHESYESHLVRYGHPKRLTYNIFTDERRTPDIASTRPVGFGSGKKRYRNVPECWHLVMNQLGYGPGKFRAMLLSVQTIAWNHTALSCPCNMPRKFKRLVMSIILSHGPDSSIFTRAFHYLIHSLLQLEGVMHSLNSRVPRLLARSINWLQHDPATPQVLQEMV